MEDSAAPQVEARAENLMEMLSQKVVGQSDAMQCIVPYVQIYQAGLAPDGRPAGIFLLLGPTGTGKTKTVEVLADILHGSEKKIVKIDCGEFQMEHEVVKLVGAPPGYVGHRETESLLTQKRLAEATSDACDLSVVLFDEIEKASPSVTQLLLGILDRATLRLGDNTEVQFDKSLIFFTSNLGARSMMKEIHPDFGFQAAAPRQSVDISGKLENIALAAVRKMYSPEFVNRIDAVITYQPLDTDSLSMILDQQIRDLQTHVNTRLADRCFNIEVLPKSREFLLERGTSREYGARELKRTIHRFLTQPLATLVIGGKVSPGSTVTADLNEKNESLELVAESGPSVSPGIGPSVLIVDDNQDLLHFLADQLRSNKGWRITTCESAASLDDLTYSQVPDIALLDFLLSDGNGVKLGAELKRDLPDLHVIIMTGAELPSEEEVICEEYGFQVITKPFLVEHIENLIRERLFRTSSVSGTGV